MLIAHRTLTGCRLLLLSALIGLSAGAVRAAPIDLGTVTPTGTGTPLPTLSAIGNLDQAYFVYFPFTARSIAASWTWTAAPGAQPILASSSLYRSDSLGSLLEQLSSIQSDGSSGLRLSYGTITSGYYALRLTAVSSVFIQYSGQLEVMPTDPTPPPPTTVTDPTPSLLPPATVTDPTLLPPSSVTEPSPVTPPPPVTEPPSVSGLGLPAPTPVTTPSVLSLLGLGSLALAAAMRRNRRAA